MSKKILLVIVVLLIGQSVICQHRKWRRMQTKAEMELENRNCACIHRNKYTTAQRLKFYPFNKATQIKLVSFSSFEDRYIDSATLKNGGQVKYWQYPFGPKTIDTTQFIESISLTKKQRDKLTDLFYNVGFKKQPMLIPMPGSGCFNPRNAILFTDIHGKTFARIQICFECEMYELYPEKIKIGDYCNERFKLLRNYFANAGIVYGVTKANRRSYN